MNQSIRRESLFLSACAGMLVFGIVLAILGTVFGLPEMRERLSIDLAQQGNLFLLLYLGIFISSFVVGPLTDHIGNKLTLLVSALLVAAAMAGFSSVRSIAGASLCALLLGLGGGGLNTSTNVLVSELYGEQRGRMLNLLGIFFGVGALFVPILAASIVGRFTISQLLLFCASLSAVCAVAYAVLRFPKAAASEPFSLRAMLSVAREPGVLLLGVLLFFQSGNEGCIGGWTSTFANSIGLSPRTSTLVLAGYWAALMVSRILASRVLRSFGKAKLVLVSSVGSIAGSFILLTSQSIFSIIVGVVLVGFSYAAIFPTTLAIAGDRYPRMAGTVFGVLFSIALMGGMSLPWAVGQASQQFGVRAGMVVPVLGAVGICCLSGLLLARESRPVESASSEAGVS